MSTLTEQGYNQMYGGEIRQYQEGAGIGQTFKKINRVVSKGIHGVESLGKQLGDSHIASKILKTAGGVVGIVAPDSGAALTNAGKQIRQIGGKKSMSKKK